MGLRLFTKPIKRLSLTFQCKTADADGNPALPGDNIPGTKHLVRSYKSQPIRKRERANRETCANEHNAGQT